MLRDCSEDKELYANHVNNLFGENKVTHIICNSSDRIASENADFKRGLSWIVT
jgi:hypothetical protein